MPYEPRSGFRPRWSGGLWVTQYDGPSGPQRDRLYRNQGDGVFTEVAQSKGIVTETGQRSDLNEGEPTTGPGQHSPATSTAMAGPNS